MVAFELTVFQFPFSINGVRIEIVGFPWLTEQVADSTGIWRMPGYSQQFPNVYFFNYGEILVVSIVLLKLLPDVIIDGKKLTAILFFFTLLFSHS